VVFEPDYSKYRLDQLLDVKKHTNPEIYPQRAQRIDEEIARRNRDTSNISYSPEKSIIEKVTSEDTLLVSVPAELRLLFRGSAQEYFRIWIVNLCLTILTLGIFSAWAKVRKKRYFYSHTILGGTPFQYLGQPIPILKGRVIAAIGFLLYYTANHFFTFLMLYVLWAGLVAAPWVIIRSAAFNARYSAFRNLTFHFDGGYIDAVMALYVWGIIPAALVIAWLFAWNDNMIVLGITFGVFVLLFPWWIRRLKKFIIEHTSYGGRKGLFFAKGGQFFKIYFISALIMTVALIAVGALTGAFWFTIKKSAYDAYYIVILVYAGYVFAYAYIQARSSNLVWNNIALGPARFHSTLRGRDLLSLYLTNALGIVASVGLLIPWAVMRTMKYRADNMRVILEDNIDEFQGSDISTVAAIGAETLDFFDMDISL